MATPIRLSQNNFDMPPIDIPSFVVRNTDSVARARGQRLTCTICSINMNSEKVVAPHLLGRKHLMKACSLYRTKPDKENLPPTIVQLSKTDKLFCTLCKVELDGLRFVKIHVLEKQHKALSPLFGLMDMKTVEELDCLEVSGQDQVSGTQVELLVDDKQKEIKVTFSQNTAVDVTLKVRLRREGEGPINIEDYRLITPKIKNYLTKIKQETGPLVPGSSLSVWFRVLPQVYCYDHSCPLIIVWSKDGKRKFSIRYIKIKYQNALIKELGPTSEYKRKKLKKRSKKDYQIVDGEPLERKAGNNMLGYTHELDDYKIPPLFKKTLKAIADDTLHIDEAEIQASKRTEELMDEALSVANHKAKFRLALYAEEIQLNVDMHCYDMHNVPMKKSDLPRRLKLEVPGLAEKRPSVLKGDHLFAIQCDAEGNPSSSTKYKGYVHKVEQSFIHLGFSKDFVDRVFVPNMKFNIEFSLNRFSLRLQHRALDFTDENSLDCVTFPGSFPGLGGDTQQPAAPKQGSTNVDDLKLSLKHKILETNPEQLRAIKHIVSGSARPAPYIVFGPPGTGKTVTIVEAMKQILEHIKGARILACAPSNSAADLITERLSKHVDKALLFRILASSRHKADVPENIRAYCKFDSYGDAIYPSKQDFEQFRVVVSTLVTAGRLASANFPPGFFTHLFVDEAGHATEPETLISIAGIFEPCNGNGQIVLAGDPLQLGPIIRSPFATRAGLHTSLLERYMTTQSLYYGESSDLTSQSTRNYDPRYVTKLLNNYRSHPEILHLPNHMFYKDELVPAADQMSRESLCKWEGLPTKDFPLVFHGVEGKDEREADSPSFFNPTEVDQVLDYVTKLLDCKNPKIQPKDIGIITPYRKQVQKISQELKKMQIKDISQLTVGSTEEYQGQERRVIIVSTVRSNPEYLTMDQHFALGFLINPKRFNVSITRAKQLIIIIGNPNVLAMDRNWGQLLKFCRDHKAYIGCQYQEVKLELNDLADTFDELTKKLHVSLDQPSPEQMFVGPEMPRED